MNEKNISAFLRAAELQSFSKAAQQLDYSQASITVQIRQLEEELNVQLFERIGKRVKLTAEGNEFIPYAQRFLKAEEEARLFHVKDHAPSGRLKVGVVESLAISLLPDILSEFHKLYPLVETSLHTGTTEELFEKIRQNEIDILYFFDRKMCLSDWIKIFEQPEPVVFLTSSSHPLANKKGISLEEVLSYPFMLTESGISYRYDLEQMTAEQQLELHPFLETGNTETIVKLLLKNEGISFLPQYTVQKYLHSKELSVLDMDIPKTVMWRQLIHHKNKWLNPQLEAFIRLMTEHQFYNSLLE